MESLGVTCFSIILYVVTEWRGKNLYWTGSRLNYTLVYMELPIVSQAGMTVMTSDELLISRRLPLFIDYNVLLLVQCSHFCVPLYVKNQGNCL